VQEDPWGYPIVLSCHAVGMALLAGVVLMMNFRVLGLGRAVPLRYLHRLMNLAFVGLILNLLSGLMLFVADAVSHYENTAFRIKILLLVAGGILIVLLSRRVFTQSAAHGVTDHSADYVADESASTRVIAGLCVLVWTGVIVAGRLIAYAE
jgi:zinc transporter ZupT